MKFPPSGFIPQLCVLNSKLFPSLPPKDKSFRNVVGFAAYIDIRESRLCPLFLFFYPGLDSDFLHPHTVRQ